MYETERINPKLLGGDYDYDADSVPDDKLMELWKLLEEHYSRPIDMDWCE